MQLQTEVNSVTPQPLPAIYCVSHCYNAPLPDERAPKLTVLAFDSTTNALIPVQQTMLPEGTLMPIAQVINQKGTKLFTTAGKHGVVCYHLAPRDHGKIIGGPILRWHRQLVANKWDYSDRKEKKTGRPKTRQVIADLTVKFAKENPT